MESLQKLIATLHPLERKLVPFLAKCSTLEEATEKSGLKEIEVMRALQWLDNKKVIELITKAIERVVLDTNGEAYVKEGLPEHRFLLALEKKSLSLEEISKASSLSKEEVSVCLGLLRKQNAITLDKGTLSITDEGKKILKSESPSLAFLKKVGSSDEGILIESLAPDEKKIFSMTKKRKNLVKVISTNQRSFSLTELGRKLVTVDIKEDMIIDSLTPDMLKEGTWKDKTFRRYDVCINVPEISGGKRHFVNQAIGHMKSIWLEMGFKEMTGPLLHTAFWNLDALFIPQDHPARTMQDTFYLKEGKESMKGRLPPVAEKVKAAHEHGGDTGSTGWQCKWSEDEAKQVLLRTHTTVLSAQFVHALRNAELPAKFFSVNKVFRNEALDWKHLFEFNQVEGIVVDPNADLKHLIGYLKSFYKKMGYKDVRVRPAHFPYTEPSLEVDVLHPVKNEWIELGGAGIFRPEVVKPLLGIDCPVLAWGQGMERIATTYFEITDLRDLYKNDIKQLRTMKSFMMDSRADDVMSGPDSEKKKTVSGKNERVGSGAGTFGFAVDRPLLEKIPGLFLMTETVSVGGSAADGGFEKEKEAIVAKWSGKTPKDLDKVQLIVSYRELQKKLGIEKQTPAVENLLTRYVLKGTIPSINTFVDGANIASLTNLVPIGLFDADKIKGGVVLTLSKKGDTYIPIGKEKAQTIPEGSPILKDEEKIISIIGVRDSSDTMVTSATKQLLLVSWGTEDVAKELVKNALSDARKIIEGA